MAFGAFELNQYLAARRIIGPQADYIMSAAQGLSRDVRPSGHPSMVVEYQSRKMGVTVNAESRTAEYVYVLQLESDDSVLAYYEQPPPVDVKRLTKRGYKRLTPYHPDMLVLRTDGPAVIQVKPLAALEELVAEKSDWIKLADGSFQDLPAQEALAAKGLRHLVVPIGAIDRQRAANIALMLAALRCPGDDDDLAGRAALLLEEHALLTLAELARELEQQDYTPLIRLIANHRLHTNLDQYSLSHPEACVVAREPEMLVESFVQAWQELALCRQGQGGSITQCDLQRERYLRKALASLEELAAGRNDRSARRWKAQIRKAEVEGTSAVVALCRGYGRRGNRKPRRPQQIAFATLYITEKWGGREKPTRSSLYRAYKVAAETALPESQPLSRPTFYALLEKQKQELAYQRGGNRARNAAMSPTDVKDRALRPERPFELATCDHYLCDLFCAVLVANGIVYAMKPWLTVLRDVATSSVLALWLRLAAPSKRSVALMTRQCVRSHGRLPEAIIEDNGSEFASVYNSALAAHYGFSLIFRPKGHPRFGSEAERFFGQFKEFWLSGRPGNLVNQQEVRAVSGSHRPEKLATMTLFDLWQELLAFHQWIDNSTSESKLGSPVSLMHEGCERYSCSGIKVEYNDEFVVATAVDVGEYKLDPQRGLHIGAFHYWCEALKLEPPRTRILVRIDPQDPYHVYALTGGHWVTCSASIGPSHEKLSPLQQAVRGTIQLDRKELTKAIKEDSDRLLVQAIQSCDVALSNSRVQIEEVGRTPLLHEIPKDLFAEVRTDHLPQLEEVPW